MLGGSNEILLPEDVVFRILLWLPVISLLRFKCVSKSWHTLIESSSFIHRHVALKDNYDGNHYVYQRFNTKKICLLSAFGDKFEEVIVKNLNLPVSYFHPSNYKSYIFLQASCNGVLCIHDQVSGIVTLWNPATKQLRHLPKPLPISYPPNVPKQRLHIVTYVGFGCAVKTTNDYKAILITAFSDYPDFDRVQVYSLSSDSWRIIDPGPCESMVCLEPIYLNGFIYWVKTHCVSIVSFDVSDEVMRTMALPDISIPSRSNVLSNRLDVLLFVMGENIACYGTDIMLTCYIEIWVLYEFGVKDSWTKLYTIEHFPNIDRQVAFSKNGKFILLRTNDSYLKLWDPVNQATVKCFQAYVGRRNFVHKESLVSVNGGHG